MVLSDEKIVHYWVPTMKLETYTRNSIFEKNLLMLLPFYIMRYEKDIHEMSENPEMFQSLLNDYEEIRINLERELLKPLPVTERSLLEAKVPPVKRRTSCVYADLRKLHSEMEFLKAA